MSYSDKFNFDLPHLPLAYPALPTLPFHHTIFTYLSDSQSADIKTVM